MERKIGTGKSAMQASELDMLKKIVKESVKEALKQIEEQKNKSLGKYKLGKKLDDINIRNFAHN